VINLYRYREVAPASNRRYLDALAVVDDPAPAYRRVGELTEPVVVSGRSHAGFNPASPGDVRLFRAVLAGENLAVMWSTTLRSLCCVAGYGALDHRLTHRKRCILSISSGNGFVPTRCSTSLSTT
jgi:hypothetical protein